MLVDLVIMAFTAGTLDVIFFISSTVHLVCPMVCHPMPPANVLDHLYQALVDFNVLSVLSLKMPKKVPNRCTTIPAVMDVINSP
jgi:hypothetical protein